MKKKVFFTALFLMFVLVVFNYANIENKEAVAVTVDSTDSFREGEWVPNVFIIKSNTGNWNSYSWEQNRVIRRNSNGDFVYCVQPFVKIQYGVGYEGYKYEADIGSVMSNMSKEKWDRITLLTQYGYGYQDSRFDHTNLNYYGITQYLIWKTVEPNILIAFCDNLNNAKNKVTNDHRWDAQIAEIETLISEHYITPSFNMPDKLIIGKEYALTDNNNVLYKYAISNTDGCNVRISGNTLYITANRVGNFSFNLRKGDPNASSTLYVKPDAQNCMTRGTLAVNQGYDGYCVGARIKVAKRDRVTENIPQGISTFMGATFEVTNESGNLVARLVTGQDGTAITDYLDLGTYYIRETSAPYGYKVNNDLITVTITEANIDPNNPVIEVVSKDDIKLGKVEVAKFDDSLEGVVNGASTGAVLRLILTDQNGLPKMNNDGSYYYSLTTTIDNYGNASFIDENNAKVYGREYTIPFGYYIIREEKGSNSRDKYMLYFLDNSVIKVGEDNNQNNTREYKIYHDYPIPVRLTVEKVDRLTGARIGIEGATFRIWDANKNVFIDGEFKTSSSGEVTLPSLIPAGNYRIYETKAPIGYTIPDEYKLPQKGGMSQTEYIKLLDTNGKEVDITDEALNLTNKEAITIDGIEYNFNAKLDNKPIFAKIQVEKYGTMLVSSSEEKKQIEGEEYDVHSLNYEERGLDGVEFTLYAKEDIYSVDGKSKYYNKGDEVAKILTSENGKGVTDREITLGKVANTEKYPELTGKDFGGVFEIKETVTPYGYQKEENMEDIIITSDDLVEDGSYVLVNREYHNDKLHIGISFNKIFNDSEYIKGMENEKRAAFALYANNDIYSYNGEKLVDSGDILDIIEIQSEDEIKNTNFNVDLPEGDYSYKEIFVSFPYIIDENTYTIHAQFDTNKSLNMIEGESILNDEKTVNNLIIFKVSKTYFYAKNHLGYVGDLEASEEIDEAKNKIAEDLISTLRASTLDEVKTYLEDGVSPNLIQTLYLSGAKYNVYVDEECTQTLKIKKYNPVPVANMDNIEGDLNGVSSNKLRDIPNPLELYDEDYDYEDVVIDTDEGYGVLQNLPLGTYYIKETVAPFGYELSPEVLKIDVTEDDTRKDIYRLIDDRAEGIYITKSDFFTSELIPNCTFKIYDKDENELLDMTTNEEGIAYIPIDIFENGETYLYEEVSTDSPLYILPEEKYEFTASWDIIEDDKGISKIQWTGDALDVKNQRKFKKLKVLKLDDKTSKPLSGCVFSIVLLDENGNPKLDSTGDYIYLVKEGVTNENGEYIIDKAYYGTYKFTEVKAPEGYELNERDMEGYVFTIDDNSADEIDFVITNTGDIAVITITIIGLLSIVGLFYVVFGKKIIKDYKRD